MTTLETPRGQAAPGQIIATIPVLLAYPFLQKHFAKGMLIGSVKG